MTDKIVLLVTCSSASEARKIARSLVKRRLAACVNVLGTPVESIYWWKGKVESAKERVLVIKTSRSRFVAVQDEVRRLHGYDVPEIIGLPIVAGSRDYLSWIAESVRGEKKPRKKRR